MQIREWACKNPEAQMYGKHITVEDHQNSPVIVDPYHLFDVAQVSDGACAFIVDHRGARPRR